VPEVRAVALAGRRVVTDRGDFLYDRLVLACGATHSYFGKEEWEPVAPGLKTLEQATEIRRRVLQAFEEAENASVPELAAFHQSFVVVGAGPTGVELAGTLGEINQFSISGDFRRLSPKDTRIYLIEAGPRILPSFSEALGARARRDLESLGVEVLTGTKVLGIDDKGVDVEGARTGRIRAATVLWAAGVQASPINRRLGLALDRAGRVPVGEDLSLAGHPEVFVIGDQAHREQDGKTLPGVAPVAMQQGAFVARALRAELESRPRGVFRYRDKGQMATIGRSRAVAEVGPLRMTGWLAWMAWLFVHILYLLDFRNRFFVLLEWTWSYVSFRRGARLILSKAWRSFGDSPKAAE